MEQKTIDGGSTGASTPMVTIVNNADKKDKEDKEENKD